MASLLIVRRGADIVGHCDANCYEARHDVCTCVCEGANHGIGYMAAVGTTRRLHREWLDRVLSDHPGAVYELGDDVTQLSLFPLPQEP